MVADKQRTVSNFSDMFTINDFTKPSNRTYDTPRRNRFDRVGINENSQVMYKNGFSPRTPDANNSASALFASGWRTQSQLDKIAQKKARKK